MSRTVRSLAAEAGLTVDGAVVRLRAAGLGNVVGKQRLDGEALARAERALGVAPETAPPPAPASATRLDREWLTIQLLRPMLTKGKLGPTHTTPIEHLYGHGIPDHQKSEAKELVGEFLREGLIDEKVSQGRRHVWLTNAGRAALARAEREAEN